MPSREDLADDCYSERGDLRQEVAELKRRILPEICICAAIITAEGYIIRGHRHDDCMYTADKMGYTPARIGDAGQGFMTSTNRFVGRKEAMMLQRAAGLGSAMSDDGKLHGTILFSEDLY
jgi:hypothetical protein